MIDMYDLPTEAELAQAIMESAKKNDTTGEIDEKRIFPFWSPTGGKNVVKLSDKTGVVTPKVDFTQTETRMDKVWEDFLASERAKDKKNAKPVTEVDAFGSVVLSSFAQEPDTDKLVGSIKALKKTSVKDMKGKVTHTTEELGVAKVITKSNAAKPNKNNLVGIVKPKTDKECFKSLPGAPSIKMVISRCSLPRLKQRYTRTIPTPSSRPESSLPTIRKRSLSRAPRQAKQWSVIRLVQ